MLTGRKPTKAESEWMSVIKRLGCIVCINNKDLLPFEVDGAYTSVHHMHGKTQPEAHFYTLPLCHRHHQNHKGSYHSNPTLWETVNGTQETLLKQVRLLVKDR